MHNIELYEGQLRSLGVATRLPGPGRFRLDRIPAKLNIPGRGVGEPGSGRRG